MLPFFAWKIFSISFFISLDFYLQVLFFNYTLTEPKSQHIKLHNFKKIKIPDKNHNLSYLYNNKMNEITPTNFFNGFFRR